MGERGRREVKEEGIGEVRGEGKKGEVRGEGRGEMRGERKSRDREEGK